MYTDDTYEHSGWGWMRRGGEKRGKERREDTKADRLQLTSSFVPFIHPIRGKNTNDMTIVRNYKSPHPSLPLPPYPPCHHFPFLLSTGQTRKILRVPMTGLPRASLQRRVTVLPRWGKFREQVTNTCFLLHAISPFLVSVPASLLMLFFFPRDSFIRWNDINIKQQHKWHQLAALTIMNVFFFLSLFLVTTPSHRHGSFIHTRRK